MDKKLPWGAVLREMEPGDVEFIVARWFWEAKKKPVVSSGGIVREEFTRRLVVSHATSGRSLVLVAANPAEPGAILGYTVFHKIGDAAVVHWVFVRGGDEGGFRNRGLGEALLRAAVGAELGTVDVRITHQNCWTVAPHREQWRLIYDPHLIAL